mgnify:CR=1 FL=1
MTPDLHSLVAAYALDALDDDERDAFEAHLPACATCQAELAGYADVVGELAEATADRPSPDVRDSVLARLDETEQVRPTSMPTSAVADLADRRRRKLSIANMLTAAAAAVILIVGAVVMSGSDGDGYDDVASAADAVVARLEGERGAVELAYSADLDRVALRGDDVGDLEPGLRYALWAIAYGTPTPAGLFDTDDGAIDDTAELTDVVAEAWGITVEPESGSDAPTTEILYFAET